MRLAAFVDDKEANRMVGGDMDFGRRKSKILGDDADNLLLRFSSVHGNHQKQHHCHQ